MVGFGLALAISCLIVFTNLFVNPLPASIAEQWIMVVLSVGGIAVGIWVVPVKEGEH